MRNVLLDSREGGGALRGIAKHKVDFKHCVHSI